MSSGVVVKNGSLYPFPTFIRLFRIRIRELAYTFPSMIAGTLNDWLPGRAKKSMPVMLATVAGERGVNMLKMDQTLLVK